MELCNYMKKLTIDPFTVVTTANTPYDLGTIGILASH